MFDTISFTPDASNPQSLTITDSDSNTYQQSIPPAVLVTPESFDAQIAAHQGNIDSLNSQIQGYQADQTDLANRVVEDQTEIGQEQAAIDQLTAQKAALFPPAS